MLAQLQVIKSTQRWMNELSPVSFQHSTRTLNQISPLVAHYNSHVRFAICGHSSHLLREYFHTFFCNPVHYRKYWEDFDAPDECYTKILVYVWITQFEKEGEWRQQSWISIFFTNLSDWKPIKNVKRRKIKEAAICLRRKLQKQARHLARLTFWTTCSSWIHRFPQRKTRNPGLTQTQERGTGRTGTEINYRFSLQMLSTAIFPIVWTALSLRFGHWSQQVIAHNKLKRYV